MPRSPRPPKAPVSFDTVRELALALPGVEEGTSYGTPALKVKGKFLLRLREDGESLAVRLDFDTRDLRLQADPEAFFLTDHYRGYPAILVRLSAVSIEALQEVIEEAWRFVAPKRLVAQREARKAD
ncbi:MAG TPA: MmcQ/YjbR family DNA-binding protein [Thermoanaerobaculia bacterium]|nr:MmcQ/YjbR family DNA-binding protein [Thermoanaerobaculia bacterium]